jgi:lipopolysaccharide/colanic/teichoic acid biosynthesis glycosyltransferase
MISYPFIFWFIRNGRGFFLNIVSVIKGQISWVGYSRYEQGLPEIKPGVLNPTDEINAISDFDNETVQKLDYLYGRDYTVYKDLSIIFKSFMKLGNQKNIQ